MADCTDQWRAILNKVTNMRVTESMRNFVARLWYYFFPKENSVPWSKLCSERCADLGHQFFSFLGSRWEKNLIYASGESLYHEETTRNSTTKCNSGGAVCTG
jgi:hypothetical protein